jgi:CubicO group peptidase (beta-lactamase class C family)
MMLATMGAAQESERMADVIKAQADSDRFMGSVLVAKGDNVVFEMSVGQANVEWNIPNSATTKFRIGSLTKQFSAAAVLLLQERGKLQVDEPISKYLDGVPASWRPITLRQLLTHTSGIPDTTDLPNKVNREWELFDFTPTMLFAQMRGLPLDFEPGTEFKYSNTGYLLLGWIIERVSGQTYREFLKQNLFDPIGMADSGYDSSVAIIPHRASGYEVGNRMRNTNYIDMRAPGAAGGLYSTTGDLLKWTRALFCGKILQPDSLEEMTTPAKGGYVSGLQVGSKNGRKRYAHAGGINGFGSFLAYFPASGVTIVVLSNVAGPAAPQLEERLEQIYFGE